MCRSPSTFVLAGVALLAAAALAQADPIPYRNFGRFNPGTGPTPPPPPNEILFKLVPPAWGTVDYPTYPTWNRANDAANFLNGLGIATQVLPVKGGYGYTYYYILPVCEW